MASKHLSEDEIRYVVSAETSKAQKELYDLSKETQRLRKEERHRRQAMVELEAQGKKNSEEYKRLANECKEYTKRISDNIAKENELRKKLDVNVMSMEQLRKQSKSLKRELEQTSKALEPERYAELEKQVKKVDTRINELKVSAKSLREIATNPTSLGAISGIAAVKIAEKMGEWLKRMKDIAAEGIEMAESADGVKHAFDRLDDGSILDNLRKATKGTVTDLDLMKATVQAKDFRIPLEDLGKYLQFAQLKAQQTGQSVEYMTSSIITGLGRKSVMILDNLGLSAAEINEQVSKTGDFMSAVASIVDKQLAAAGENYVSASDRAQAATVRFQNAQLKLGQTLLPLKEDWDEFSTGFSIKFMELIGWAFKHRDVLLSLIAVYSAYKAAVHLVTTVLQENLAVTKGSILVDKLKVLWTNNTRGALLLLKAAYFALTGNMQKATAAMTAFNTACKANLIGLLVAAIVAAVAVSYKWTQSLRDRYNMQKVLNDVNEKSIAQYEREKTSMERLYRAVHDNNLSLDERREAVEKLKEMLPGYRAEITAEGKVMNESTRSLEQMNQELLRNIKLKNMREELFRRYREVDSLEKRLGKNDTSLMGSMAREDMRNKLANERKALEELKEEYKALYRSGLSSSGGKSTGTKESKDLIELKRKEIEEAEKVVATTKQEVAARNRKVAALKAELEALQNLGVRNTKDRALAKVADKELKDIVRTEKEAVKSLETLREDALQSQQEWYNRSAAGFNTALSENRMSKDEYDMMMLSLEKENAEARLNIEREFYEDAHSMAVTDAETKEDIVRKSNQRVVEAEKVANDKRAAMQTVMTTLVKDFKEQFRVTTLDEDLQLQLEVLEASYQARLKMAEQEKLDTTELDKAYYRAKEQLEFEHQQKIQGIRDQYGLSTQQERFDAELAQLRFARDQQLLAEEEYEQAVQNLKRDSYKKQFDYYAGLFSGAVQALQQAEMDQVDARYDAEIEAAKGDAEAVERLENEKAQKKLDIQKKYADVNFAIKASQIVADTAVSIMKALADLGPIVGPVFAALMGVTGAAQLASAKAERDKVKNMTLSGSSSSSAGTYARVATGRQSGGKIDVRRAQDGKLFPNADYNPDARGFISRPTVIVGEGPAGQSKEWVASNAAVENPTVAPILDILDKSQQAGTIRTLDLNKVIQARLAGYASGGAVNMQPIVSPVPSDIGYSLPPQLMERFANAIIHLDEEGFPPASVFLTDFERKQQLRDRSRKIGSK